MAKQTFTTGQVLTAAQMTSLQQTAMGGGSTTAKTASYTLAAADAGTVVQMNSASATTITVNQSLFAAGDTVQIQNVGAGVCTVTAGTATVSTAGSLALSQYEGGQLYFNTTSAALFFDIVQTSGMTNPMTTTGDIIYSSSGSTPARLGIGTTGQVLNVASGIPAWATPASGGMTIISTGTLSSTGLTFSSIPGTYYNLQLSIAGFNAGGSNLQIRVNGDTGANYVSGSARARNRAGGVNAAAAAPGTASSATFDGEAGPDNSATNTQIIFFPQYAAPTGAKAITGSSYTLSTYKIPSINFTSYNGTEGAITSITILTGGTFSAGTYTLYGVK